MTEFIKAFNERDLHGLKTLQSIWYEQRDWYDADTNNSVENFFIKAEANIKKDMDLSD